MFNTRKRRGENGDERMAFVATMRYPTYENGVRGLVVYYPNLR